MLLFTLSLVTDLETNPNESGRILACINEVLKSLSQIYKSLEEVEKNFIGLQQV